MSSPFSTKKETGEKNLSLIKDVSDELAALDQSTKQVRRFSVLMLVVFGALGYYSYIHRMDAATSINALLFLFFLSGLRCSGPVRRVHKYWMGLAFGIGWFVSRILLACIYFLIVTPIGLISRMLGKSFLNMDFRQRVTSYWIVRDEQKHDYGKMS